MLPNPWKGAGALKAFAAPTHSTILTGADLHLHSNASTNFNKAGIE